MRVGDKVIVRRDLDDEEWIVEQVIGDEIFINDPNRPGTAFKKTDLILLGSK